ncbi:hypothetical protein JIN77_08210 [Verrucomicrobiaceae bacterium R5-34]|uniref:Uncharacterized protein n=1 Tax=Oceaniferula flava TaxID=2800421 RepID=A0AAE2SCL6_9BACT|nr:hypothetical protein [Oceaniferula flavus]MBK1830706.1 hypothetical protein [Verrucomicrobiaceae bacterium R5-34]MBK1855963.1 hypothetical protein [Oceaniferula flavus]MBM1137270.1 hypothetical protein [Oceaniferula flavus]
MKYLSILFNLLAGLILTRFTISKFAAWPVSVAAFEDMAKPLGIDPTMFRIGTGFIIGFATLAFFTNVVLIALRKQREGKGLLWFAANNLYAIGAMTGALLSEFFLRTEVKMPLVYIAIAVMVVAIVNLLPHLGKFRPLLASRGLVKASA